jgi:hypothetical protein
MLNPSSAGWPEPDMTVTKLCGFAARISSIGGSFEPIQVRDGGAVFSSDGVYRYRLWRIIETPTRLVRFDVVNMFGLVSTDPAGLQGKLDPVGPDNLRHIGAVLAEADTVIAAWGSLKAHPSWVRAAAVHTTMLLTARRDVHALALTADGSPAHPSRLPYTSKLVPFRARRVAA